MTTISENIELYEFDTFGEAQQQAAAVSMSSFSQQLPAVMYRQGGRVLFSTSIPLAVLANLVRTNSASKGSTDPENYVNRPIMPEHVKSISNYLTEADPYIIPGITLNVKEIIKVYAVKSHSPVNMAVIILPSHAAFFVTDGQHRLKGVEDALPKRPELSSDAVSVTIVVEPDMDQIHQDFADCAQTRSIPPALLTLYNKSDELSKLTVDVANSVDFFKGRLEKVGNTVSKRSTNFYTLNHIRMSVATVMTGNAAAGSAALSRATAAMLSSEQERIDWKNKLVWLYSTLSDEIPEWRLVKDVNLGLTSFPESFDLSTFRSEYFHFTGTGLAIIGAAAYGIFNYFPVSEQREKKVLELAKLVDWRRTVSGKVNPFWLGSIVSEDGRMLTSRYALEAGVNRVNKLLKIEKPAA